MASAKKCDICGKLYELYNDKDDVEKPNGLMFLNIDAYRKYFGHDIVDCCPECMSLIIDFIATLGIANTKIRR